MRTLFLALVAATRLSPSYAKAPCPLYGPIFPKPTKLLSDPAVQYAATLLDGIFPQYIDNANSSGSERFSYSVEVFSATEDLPLYAHHWTATNLPLLNSSGVTRVTGDSVYRIGSITKIFTILAFLATVGDSVMNDPVSKHLPEIAELAAQSSGSAIWAPDWDSITVGSLATQTSGLIRDCKSTGEATLSWRKHANAGQTPSSGNFRTNCLSTASTSWVSLPSLSTSFHRAATARAAHGSSSLPDWESSPLPFRRSKRQRTLTSASHFSATLPSECRARTLSR